MVTVPVAVSLSCDVVGNGYGLYKLPGGDVDADPNGGGLIGLLLDPDIADMATAAIKTVFMVLKKVK